MNEPIPVTVLSGILGAGKTTTLNQILTEYHGYEVAVLVNDMGEVNIDAEYIERRVEDEREVIEFSNGCICCGIQGEFEQAISDLANSESFDYLLVELSGISKPAPVAQQLIAVDSYELSSVTTIIDSRQFFDAFNKETKSSVNRDDDQQQLSNLIVSGVEFCDTIIVNKIDLVNEEELKFVQKTLRTLQPEAELVTTKFGQIDVDDFLTTSRFDIEHVSESAHWRRTLNRYEKQNHEAINSVFEGVYDDPQVQRNQQAPTDEYRVDSFVYHQRTPMHPERLINALSKLSGQVVRAKGWMHVAGRPDHVLMLSIAGKNTRINVAGRWIASLSIDPQMTDYTPHDIQWDETYGDRQTKLVIIGQDLDEEGIETMLNDCLLTDEEQIGEHFEFKNPFPDKKKEILEL